MTYKYVEISDALRAEGFYEQFVRVVMKVAEEYDGLQDLLTMWQNEEDPRRCFPDWHKHQLRIDGFPVDYIHQVIYLSRNFAGMRELLERWINEESSSQ